jgi:hypothetical protein
MKREQIDTTERFDLELGDERLKERQEGER